MRDAFPTPAVTEFAAALLQATITLGLAALCLFLWRRHRKPYFLWFAVAWATYVVRLGAIVTFLVTANRFWLSVHQVLTGISAVALLWATLVFSRRLTFRARYLLAALVPPAWSIVAIHTLDSFLLAALPMVAFLSLVTMWSGWAFLRHHRRVGSPGAALLAGSFLLWGLHHLDYPLLRAQGAWSPWGYYLDILFLLAVGAGIMLLVHDDLRGGLGALSALSADLQRTAGAGDVVEALLARPLALPAVTGTALFLVPGPVAETLEVERRGAGKCAGWSARPPDVVTHDLIGRVLEDGRPHLTHGIETFDFTLGIPVVAEGEAIGVLVLAGEARVPFTALDDDFLLALGQQVGAALHGAMLYRQLARRTAELERLSTRIVGQHEAERRRLSRELHDETAQVFTAVKMQLGVLGGGLADGQQARLRRILELVDDGIRSIRSVTNDLRPSLLEDLGLLPALRSLCAEYTERTGIAVRLDAPGDLPSLPHDADLALYRALQEGLSNVARHAGASRVEVRIAERDDSIVLVVVDDGRGMQGSTSPALLERGGHMGLVGMRERILALGGDVTLRPRQDGRAGAELEVRVPLRAGVPAGGAA